MEHANYSYLDMKMLNTSEINRKVPVTCSSDAPLVGGLGQAVGDRLLGLLFPTDGRLVGGCVVLCVEVGLSESSGHSSQLMVVLKDSAVTSG